jgi:hypothetical protein
MFKRNTQERAAQLEAANAEIGRLCALPLADLAPEVLPAFKSQGSCGRTPARSRSG